MKCIMCKQADVIDSSSTVTLEKDGTMYSIQNVPSRVCPRCYEGYLKEEVVLSLRKIIDHVKRQNTSERIIDFTSHAALL